jgi:hypothetical protein
VYLKDIQLTRAVTKALEQQNTVTYLGEHFKAMAIN